MMEWPMLELDKITKIRSGGISPGSQPQLKYELFSIPGYDTGGPEYLVGEEIKSNKTCVEPGDVLFSKLNPRIPRVWIVPEKAGYPQVSSTEFWPLICDDKIIYNKYLRHLLLWPSFRERFAGSTEAATKSRSRIKPFQLMSQKIPLPSPSEQRRIVEILDQAEQLRDLRVKAEKKTEHILPALFIKMFGDPITNPMGWSEKTLGETLKKEKGALQSGPFGTHLHNYDFVENGTVLAVGIDNVHDKGFELGRERRITQDKYLELEKYTLIPGDILITIMGTIGRTCVFPEWAGRAICTKHVYRIQVNPSIFHPEYVTASIRFSQYVRSQLGTSVTGQIVSGITSKALKGLSLYTPPVKLQECFAEIKLAMDKDIKIKQYSKSKIDSLFGVLLHRAFTGDLTASWRQAHMKELLQEMELQAKALAA